MPDKKIGLALGGGSARGMAHIGVLEVLRDEGIPVHVVAGTSAGAAIGALFAEGKSIEFIKEAAIKTHWRQVFPFLDIAVLKTGLHTGRRFTDWMKQQSGGDVQFDELKLPFACVATDIMTGEEVVLREGSVAEAIRASSSIPGLFTVVKWHGRYLVDGLLVSPVPVSLARSMGADFVIAVNVLPDVRHRDREGNGKEPGLMTVMMQALSITTHTLVRNCLEDADIVIEPAVSEMGASDFDRVTEAIEHGRVAAQEAIPQIKERLQKIAARTEM